MFENKFLFFIFAAWILFTVICIAYSWKVLWQLPQTLIGALVVLITGAKWNKQYQIFETKYKIGVSFGIYIILYEYCGYKEILHEKGHSKQSLYLGPLYLLIIGIPSVIGNVVDRICHKVNEKHSCWYYSQPWEKWADKLGGVKR